MQDVLSVVSAFSSAALLLSPHAFAQERPLTTAESSQFKATTRHAEAMAFIRELQRRSSRLRVETIAVSTEGRQVPMLVIGNPPHVRLHIGATPGTQQCTGAR